MHLKRTPTDPEARTSVLIKNRHSCCVCGSHAVQVHHINSKPTDHREANLAVLCVPHHDQATKVGHLTAKLTPPQVRRYKKKWEAEAAKRSSLIARGRTAFFMVDYKNVDRLNQLFLQLPAAERASAVAQVSEELKHESLLRQGQDHAVSMEPTLAWNGTLESYLIAMGNGANLAPNLIGVPGHPLDTSMPASMPAKGYHDIWCQLMARVLVSARGTIALDQLAMLSDPIVTGLAGKLLDFQGRVSGDVAPPENFRTTPSSLITLEVVGPSSIWRTTLTLRTHYVYSFTATLPLGKGLENGLLLFRGIASIDKTGPVPVVTFEATPLIVGNGVLVFPIK